MQHAFLQPSLHFFVVAFLAVLASFAFFTSHDLVQHFLFDLSQVDLVQHDLATPFFVVLSFFTATLHLAQVQFAGHFFWSCLTLIIILLSFSNCVLTTVAEEENPMAKTQRHAKINCLISKKLNVLLT